MWHDNLLSYNFGNPQKVSPNYLEKDGKILESLISIPKSYHNLNIITSSGALWDTSQKDAIEKGDLIHLILSKVNTKHDIEFACNDLKQSGELTSEQEELLKPLILRLVTHPKLKNYFDSSLNSYNEHDIISKNGEIIRPDKLVFLSDNNAVLIDYKSGKDKQDHIKQIQNYKAIIEEMDIKISKKILVYINDDIKVKEI
jgi:hypothetical protein